MNDQGQQNLEIEKIIVSPEDELIDILKEIEKSNANHIILTFAEPTDLLISPITLKVIQDSADEKNRPLIALIIQNPVGVRNAKEAGMTVTETSGSIVDTFWEVARRSMEERLEEKKGKLKKTYSVSYDKKEKDVNPENAKTSEEFFTKDNNEESRSEFQKKVKEAIEKSKQGIDLKKKIVSQNGVLLGIDQDIEEKDEQSLTGKNFKDAPVKIFTDSNKEKGKKMKKFKLPKISLNFFLKLLIPLVILAIGALVALYFILPSVNVKIFVESKNVSIDKVFAGDTKVTELNTQDGKVPVKKETVEKTASDSTQATGTAYKGTKADGIIIVKYYDIVSNPSGVTLNAGTVITSSGGLKYETTATAQIKNFINDPIPVKALSVGEEYNLAAGQLFTVAGYTGTQMDASNSDAFEGGSKTSYVILSKADVDKTVKTLQKNLTTEATNELTSKIDDTWEIVEKSITTALDGDPSTDVPIGAEADTVNITIKLKSTALYYQKNALEQAIPQMLTKNANDQGLFENTTNSLSLDENMTKEIAITEIKKDTIKVSVKAESNIQPQINKEEIISSLKGKTWKEGLAIIGSTKFTSRDNEVTFKPSYFPDFLRYFPSTNGKIIITVEEVK